MQSSYIPIDNWHLALAAVLILVNLGLSLALQLELEKRLWVAAFRMVVQLLLIGYVLNWIFTLQNLLWVLGVALTMIFIAGRAAVNRTERRFRQIYWSSFLSLLTSASLMTGLTFAGVINVHPWYDPQYLIPLLGMILGNALTGTSLTLDRFMEDLVRRREQIELLLSLGATRWEAARQSVKEAVRTGTIPIINFMSVVGLVSLPGMMTGQILAGASPADAVRYQIVLIFAIAAGTALTTMGIALLAFLALFSSQHQLRLDRLWQVDQKA